MREENVNCTTEALAAVDKYLKRARQYGLETEVVAWALQEMKNDPKLTIEAAMYHGCYEWDV